MSTFNFSPTVLEWAANNINISWESLAEEIVTAKTKREEKLQAAYDGKLTLKQAEKISQKTNTPFGFLFLQEPPKLEKLTIPDLRTITQSNPLSNDFYDTLEDIYKKVEWYRTYLETEGELEPHSFVGRFSFNKNLSVERVVEDIRHTINVDSKFFETDSKSHYYQALTSKIENIGILVFTNGVVKNNPRRKLNIAEFRGFAIADKYVPAVFINNSDTLSAQLFTLMHEIAHIWLGKSGVSDANEGSEIERFCNKVSAEFLMPTKLFLEKWTFDQYEALTYDSLSRIADYFKVSVFAVAVKAKQLHLITDHLVNQIKAEAIAKYQMKRLSSGGNFYATLPYRNSKTFTNVLVNQALSQQMLLRDAASMLNVKPNTIMQLYLRQQ